MSAVQSRHETPSPAFLLCALPSASPPHPASNRRQTLHQLRRRSTASPAKSPSPTHRCQAQPDARLIELVKLETEFAESVAKGGGKAFGSWFADDAVALNNGQPAVLGRLAIADSADWDPKDYQLTWYTQGAQMGPSGDTGFTWGHYDATHAKDGKTTTLSGRYITFWKKVAGKWKVALDASANEPIPPAASTP